MTVDTVFSLVGAMLMSEKVKAWTPNIYPRLVKTMDNHYSASGKASEANKAFKKIKDRLSSPPVISFPDFSQLFTLTTDTSDIACCAILMQEAENGRKKIIAVASHTFNATEQNWSTTEWEAYAIKWAISKFDYFLRNRPFVIFTDHRSLTYLDQRIFNNAKIRRWQEEISCYKFILEFVEGESNVWADMLSRSYRQQKIKTPADPTPAGKVFQVEGSDLHIYVLSWCLGKIDSLQLIPKTHSPQGIYCHKRIADAFFAYHSTSTIPTEICDDLNTAAKQSKDDLLSVIVQALQTRDPGKECRPSDSHLQETPRQILFGTRYLLPDDQRQYTLTKVDCALQTPQLIFYIRHMTASTTQASLAWRNSYPATSGSSKIETLKPM